jgi:hypothetical protein
VQFLGVRIESVVSSGGALIGHKRTHVRPYGPHNPCEFVPHGDGRHIVPAPLLDVYRPVLQCRRLFRILGVPENGASAVNQEHSDVHIALFADGSESVTRSAGIFFWRQSHVARKLSTRSKASNVAHQRDQSGRGDKPNPGHCLEQRHVRQIRRQCRELLFDGVHVRLERLDLITRRSEGDVEEHWDRRRLGQ